MFNLETSLIAYVLSSMSFYCNLLEGWSFTLKRGRSVVGFPLFEGANENFAFTVLTTFPMTTNVSKEIKKLTYITYASVWT